MDAPSKNYTNLIGMTFGRFTVLERCGSYRNSAGENKGALWLCRCSCGNTRNLTSNTINSGKVISCGCYNQEKRSTNRLIGRRFGKLVVLSRGETDKYKGGYYWICRCDCGVVKPIYGRSLKAGLIVSCGCASESGIAYQVKSFFSQRYKAITEYKAVRNPQTGKWLRFDLFVYPNIFIEINGKQHYQYIPYFHRTYEKFKYQKHTYKIKKDFAKRSGILIEIDLRKIKTLEQAIEYVEKRL